MLKTVALRAQGTNQLSTHILWIVARKYANITRENKVEHATKTARNKQCSKYMHTTIRESQKIMIETHTATAQCNTKSRVGRAFQKA